MGEKFNDRDIAVILSSQIGYEHIAMACSASFAQTLDCPPDRIEDLVPPIGFGVFLINHLADEVKFNQITDEGHAVRISVNIK